MQSKASDCVHAKSYCSIFLRQNAFNNMHYACVVAIFITYRLYLGWFNVNSFKRLLNNNNKVQDPHSTGGSCNIFTILQQPQCALTAHTLTPIISTLIYSFIWPLSSILLYLLKMFLTPRRRLYTPVVYIGQNTFLPCPQRWLWLYCSVFIYRLSFRYKKKNVCIKCMSCFTLHLHLHRTPCPRHISCVKP